MSTSHAQEGRSDQQSAGRRRRKDRAASRAPEPKNIVSGAGQPLDLSVRRELEEQLGHDFGRVRLHTGRDASALTEMLGADAVAVGQDIFFREGAYRPGTADGQRLLAHELLHTVQNPDGLGALRAGRDLGAVSLPQQAIEREAESAARSLVREREPAAPEVERDEATPGWLRYATVDADRHRMEQLDPATLVDRLANGLLRSLRGDPADLSGRVRLELARLSPQLQDSVLDRLETRLLAPEYDRLLDLAERSDAGPPELQPAGVPEPEPDLFAELGVERTRWEREEEADRGAENQRAEDAREERQDARARDEEQGGDRTRARADAAAEDQEAAQRTEQEDERARSREQAEQERAQEEEKQDQDRQRVDETADERAQDRQEGTEQAKEERKAQRDREEKDPAQADAPGADKRKRKDDATKPADGSKREDVDPKAKERPGPVRPEKVDERAERADSALSEHGLHEKDEDEGEPREEEKPLGLEAGAEREIGGGEDTGGGGHGSSPGRPRPRAAAPAGPAVDEIELSEDSSPNAVANALAFPEPIPDDEAEQDGGRSAARGETSPGERSEPEESDAADTGQDQEIGPDPQAAGKEDPAPETEEPGSVQQPDGAGAKAGEDPAAPESEAPGTEEGTPDAQEAPQEVQKDKDQRDEAEERDREGGTRGTAAEKPRTRSSAPAAREERDGPAGPAPASGLTPAGPRTERTPVEDRRPSPAVQRTTEPLKGDHDAPAPKSVIPKESGAGAAPSGTVGGSASAGPSAAAGPGSAPSTAQAAMSPAAEQAESPGRLGAPAPEGAKAQPEASLEKDGGGCAPPEPAAEKEEGAGGCGGGGGEAAPEEKQPEPPDVSGQDPKAAVATVGKLAPDQAAAAMPGVDRAADRKVGEEQRRLDAAPPERERPSGAPRTQSGPPESAAPAAPVTGKVEKLGPEDQGDKQRAKGSEKAQGAKPTDSTPPPQVPAAGKELSAEDAQSVDAAADAVPTVDPELRNKTVGPAPKIRLEGASDPTRTDDQAKALKEKQGDIHRTGREDAAKPMGEDRIFPDAPRERLVGKAGGRAGGKGGAAGLSAGSAPKPGVGAVAKQERGAEIQGATGQAQGDLAAKEKEQQQGEQRAKQEKQTEIDREVTRNAEKQTAERGRAAEEAGRERESWREEQDRRIEEADKDSEKEHTAKNKEIVKARDDKDKEVGERKDKDNAQIDTEREKAEKEAEKKKEENKPSGGFFGWVADKVKSAFNAILDAVTKVFDAARAAVNSIIDTFKEWADKAIDFVRDLAVKAISALADVLIAIGDVLLAAFPELRDRFRKAIEGMRDRAIAAVNALADGLKQAVNALLDALAAGLNALLDVLEAGLKAVIKIYQAVILGAIKFAQAAIEALGKFAALVADIAPDPGGWIGKAGSSAKAGITDHLWGAIKTGVKRWFDTKVEGILGLGKAVINVLVKGCVSVKQIGKMTWDAIIGSLPMMIASIVIEKLVSMIIPAAGAILTIVQGLMAAWQSISSILSAFGKFWAYLKAVKAGPAACLFAEAVAAGIVALLDFIANFLMIRLAGATKGVGKRLKAMAEKIMQGLKKTGKGARKAAGGAVNRARGAVRRATQVLRRPVRPGKAADSAVPGRRPVPAGPAADGPRKDTTPARAPEDKRNSRPDRTPEADTEKDTAQDTAPASGEARPDRTPEPGSTKDTAQDRTPESKKDTEPDRTPEPDRKSTEPRKSAEPVKRNSPLGNALKKIKKTVGTALKKVRNAGRTLGRKLRKSRVGQALRKSAKQLHSKTLGRMRRLKDIRRSRRLDEDRAAQRNRQREEQEKRDKESTENVGRPTVKASFTMDGERHRMVLKPSGPDVSVNMESRLLPLEDRYRAAYNEIEFFKAYVSRIEDAETRRRFEVELLDEVSDFQVDSVKQYKAAFKEAFPHRANEPLGLTRQQQAASRARVQQLVWQLRGMNRKITRWANLNGITNLDQNEIGKGIAKKGERIWDERYRNIKKTIDGVVLRFQYKGRNLQYVGSLKNEGQRGPHKGRTAFNINDFDVDLFVVHPAEWRKWLPIITEEAPQMVSNGKIFPIWPQMRELYNLGRSVGKALTRVLRGRVKDSRKFTDETDIVLREKDSY
ncbi:DUF4157 domain-containing protein [Streptomyces sp. FIT100]|uniref:eCIS core domain-containing protein n=1 Tax=Streptomyces sp. FIT100 TaxID=2837956 RepID=UPI0021CA5C9F|nr:DUF4157 domain-containing protein [Streptomyces sp. FIT100]UUN25136.1 DUF4157 domain-containing protein [Streptomyces sp. FIT100]